MGIFRILILITIVGAIYLVYRQLSQGVQSRSQQPTVDKDTVKCAYCSTHIPIDEAYQREGKYYCSESHYRASQHKPED